MGNNNSLNVSPEDAAALRKRTPFSMSEAMYLLKRYTAMDPTGKDGMTVQDCMNMPEFTGCIFAPDVIGFYKDNASNKVHPRQFMQICTMLSSKTDAKTKKEFLFDLFDVDNQKLLTHDALFRIYKLLFSNTVSDDHILALTYSALRHPNLVKDGEVSREEFMDMVPDFEIQERLSVDMIPPKT